MATRDPSAGAVSPERSDSEDPRLEKWQQRFFWPVVVAALASVPAVFLTVVFDAPWEVAGEIINHVSMAVFVAETAVLLILARDKRRWVRDHWGIVAITAVTIPAVLLALGPAQVLRVVAYVVLRLGALRIIRVGRIFKAGKILYRRTGASGPVRTGIAVAATALAAAFVALVLADPGAETWQLLDDVQAFFGGAWAYIVVAAGLVLAGATFVVLRARREPTGEGHRHDVAASPTRSEG